MTNSELFSSSLIDQSVKGNLPESYILRPLSRDDYSKGIFECLQDLTSTGEITEERFVQQCDWMLARPDVFYNVVIEHENRIVAHGYMIVERKFIWDLGKVGHLEEIVVCKAYQGKGLGKCVVRALNSVAQNVGCLKTQLQCSDENVGFYAKCGYEEGSAEMAHEFESFAKWKSDSDSD